jgi:hypothetical protein
MTGDLQRIQDYIAEHQDKWLHPHDDFRICHFLLWQAVQIEQYSPALKAGRQ